MQAQHGIFDGCTEGYLAPSPRAYRFLGTQGLPREALKGLETISLIAFSPKPKFYTNLITTSENLSHPLMRTYEPNTPYCEGITVYGSCRLPNCFISSLPSLGGVPQLSFKYCCANVQIS